MSPMGDGFDHRHHAEAVHHRLERLQRVDLGDDDVAAHPLGAHRDTPAAPAVAAHHHGLARDEDVGRADDAVQRGLARAVAVVEEMLRHRVVHGDDGVLQRALSFAIARRRMTPVVVSSVPPTTSLKTSRRFLCIVLTRSAPSSIVMCGL